MKEEIFEKAHLEESSELARKYFKELGLRIESINLKQAEKLSEFIQSEIDVLSKDESYRMVKELKMCPKINIEKYGIFLFVDGSYFKKRQAVSFEHHKEDGYTFIGLCGWASGCNRIPFIKGFIKWCDYLNIKQGGN